MLFCCRFFKYCSYFRQTSPPQHHKKIVFAFSHHSMSALFCPWKCRLLACFTITFPSGLLVSFGILPTHQIPTADFRHCQAHGVYTCPVYSVSYLETSALQAVIVEHQWRILGNSDFYVTLILLVFCFILNKCCLLRP